MNCFEFDNVALDVAREQIFEVRLRASAIDHAESCDRCRCRLKEQQHLSEHLHALAKAMTPLSAAAEINPLVIEALRSRSTVLTLHKRTRRWKTWAAAAAIALLVVGLVLQKRAALVLRNQPTDPRPAEVQLRQPESGPPKFSSSLPVKTVQDLTEHKSKPRSARFPLRSSKPAEERSPTTSRGNPNNEIATNFLSIGDTSASSLADGGQLVRVELPRSALMRFGLPVNTDQARERVKADILVGSDGIARAIRFIR